MQKIRPAIIGLIQSPGLRRARFYVFLNYNSANHWTLGVPNRLRDMMVIE